MGVSIWEGGKAERVASALEAIAQGTTGGLPEGGTQGQVLAKASATDYDVEWVDQSGGGGTADLSAIAGTDNMFSRTKPYGFQTSDGQDVVSATGYWNSGLIEIEGGESISASVSIYKTAFYTKDKVFISCDNSTHEDVSIPQNTGYFKVQISNSVISYADRKTLKLYVDDTQILRVNDSAIEENSVQFKKLSEGIQSAIGCTDGGFQYEGEKIKIVSKRFSFSPLCPSAGYQGGCVYGGKLFRFNDNKNFIVTNIADGTTYASGALSGDIVPHANSVTWGKKYSDSDPYPLVYINAYNADNLPKGTCYVYRISESSTTPVTMTISLIQTISIGFVEDSTWKSSDSDIRPYGNFCVDAENEILYVYTLRDADQHTRFFKFALPSTSSATVTLAKTDIIDQFDTDYFAIIQDNTYHDGKIYICSGYGPATNKGYIRVVDLAKKAEVSKACLTDAGLTFEPEIIDIYNDRLICGNVTVYQFLF